MCCVVVSIEFGFDHVCVLLLLLLLWSVVVDGGGGGGGGGGQLWCIVINKCIQNTPML